MPANKNAILRYQILDKCFRNTGRRYFIEDLIAECDRVLCEINPENGGISRRQIFEDIRFMESGEGWRVELRREKAGRRVYYRYEDSSFSINNSPLNETEFARLEMVMGHLSRLRGILHLDLLDDIIGKLKFRSASPTPVISFDSNPYLTGIEHIPPIYNAIVYKQVLAVEYLPFACGEVLSYTIHPYFLKQYNNRWFLFGHNPATGRYNWNLALDRIRSVSATGGEYVENDRYDWDEYFDNIIGVTKNEQGGPSTVVLHFHNEFARYIETKPIHESQRSRWLEGGIFEVKLDVMHNPELESVILSFGDNVRVIAPESLRGRIADRLRGASRLYETD